jgi:tetratricopeptide (TPR) repeat protein
LSQNGQAEGPYREDVQVAQARPSMQELIRQRSRVGFVGRGAERALFRVNFDTPPEDERHRFLFHVHGNAGVGKTFLVRELEHIAREHGALTAYVDESAGSVPDALEMIARQFQAQGRRLKELERLLDTHRARRHEAQAVLGAAAEPGPGGPSAGSMVVARAGLIGLGLIPGVGPFAGALDPAQLAEQTDRLRAGLNGRFRSHEDASLVLTPERVLTPVLLKELSDAASAVPWTVLFFDTYERTGPFLDAWLHEVMTSERYGPLPATVVVVTAGQRPFDTVRWGAFADFMADVPLEPFTASEARGLLAGKGVVAEPVVTEVLRLSGGLPVLVSTLAEARPADPADVGDPSATAVERFLKWERDPIRRGVALACALPRRLDADVFRAAVDGPDGELDDLYAWLRGMPFVSERGGRVRYHDVVRAPMLRLQRDRSPRGWAERQRALASVFGTWRAEAGAGRSDEQRWADEEWRELRLAELYHLLCAGEREALSYVLRDVVDACEQGESLAERWARVLVDAGRDADVATVARWGQRLSAALADGGTGAALGLLLERSAGIDADAWTDVLDLRGPVSARGEVYGVSGPQPAGGPGAPVARGGDTLPGGARQDATEHGWIFTLDRAAAARAHRGRAVARDLAGDLQGAVADLDRALELAPDDARSLALRGECHRALEHYDQALRDLDEAIRHSPTDDYAWASRGATRLGRGELDAALADLDRAVLLKPDYPWALVRRARVHRALGDPVRQLADLDRAVAVDPDWAWVRCERGDALRAAGRDEEALADYDHALALEPEYTSARASRGASLARLGRPEEALADLDHVLDRRPSYAWALLQRAAVHRLLGDPGRAAADEESAARLSAGRTP